MILQSLLARIALGEVLTTEFKRSGTLNFSREICAIADAAGGVIMPMPRNGEVAP